MIQFLKRAASSVKAAKAGYVRIFADETGALALKDAAGSVTPIGGGADGLSAYEVAAANGFVGDETAWLASLVGADGADGAGLASGTAFPGAPADNDLFYRTDRDILYFYHSASTQWLSVHKHSLPINVMQVNTVLNATGTNFAGMANPWYDLYAVYVEDVALAYFINNTSNWDVLIRTAADATVTTISTFAGLTQAPTANRWRGIRNTGVNAVVAKTVPWFTMDLIKNSGTAGCYFIPVITYRLVG